MIEQTTLKNILTCVIAVIIFIFQSLNYVIAWIKQYVKHEKKSITIATADTKISDSKPNDNNTSGSLIRAQELIQKHFDIPLIVAEDDPIVDNLNKNTELLNSDTISKDEYEQFMDHLIDDSYVARGLGLITATIGRETEFYLYSKYDNDFEGIVIELKERNGEVGQITILGRNAVHPVEPKPIPIEYIYDEDRIKVTYTLFTEGVHLLTLSRNNIPICRSPYYISVEKSPTNSRSRIRLGTKKYRMVTKFGKGKHTPIETKDNIVPITESSKPTIKSNVQPMAEETPIRTDVMSIITQFESKNKGVKTKLKKPMTSITERSLENDSIHETLTSINNNQPKIETSQKKLNTYEDVLNICKINSRFKISNIKGSNNVDINYENNKQVDTKNTADTTCKEENKFIAKLDENVETANNILQKENVPSSHQEAINSSDILVDTIDCKNSSEIEKQNETSSTNDLLENHNNKTVSTNHDEVQSKIKSASYEENVKNDVSCSDDKKPIDLKKDTNELESNSNGHNVKQIIDPAQYNITNPSASIFQKITNSLCEKCSRQVIEILSELPRDINIKYNENLKGENSNFETLLAQPIRININIDNIVESSINKNINERIPHLQTNSSKKIEPLETNNKMISLSEKEPSENNFVKLDVNNMNAKLVIEENVPSDEINKISNENISDKIPIPLTENTIETDKEVNQDSSLSNNEVILQNCSANEEQKSVNSNIINSNTIHRPENEKELQIQGTQKPIEQNVDFIKPSDSDISENLGQKFVVILENNDVLINNDNTNSNVKLDEDESKLITKQEANPEENSNLQSNTIIDTVLAPNQVILEKEECTELDLERQKNIIYETNDQSLELITAQNKNYALMIEKYVEPVLNSFKNDIVERIVQLYLNKDLSNESNTKIIEDTMKDEEMTNESTEIKYKNMESNIENKEIKINEIQITQATSPNTSRPNFVNTPIEDDLEQEKLKQNSDNRENDIKDELSENPDILLASKTVSANNQIIENIENYESQITQENKETKKSENVLCEKTIDDNNFLKYTEKIIKKNMNPKTNNTTTLTETKLLQIVNAALQSPNSLEKNSIDCDAISVEINTTQASSPKTSEPNFSYTAIEDDLEHKILEQNNDSQVEKDVKNNINDMLSEEPNIVLVDDVSKTVISNSQIKENKENYETETEITQEKKETEKSENILCEKTIDSSNLLKCVEKIIRKNIAPITNNSITLTETKLLQIVNAALQSPNSPEQNTIDCDAISEEIINTQVTSLKTSGSNFVNTTIEDDLEHEKLKQNNDSQNGENVEKDTKDVLNEKPVDNIFKPVIPHCQIIGDIENEQEIPPTTTEIITEKITNTIIKPETTSIPQILNESETITIEECNAIKVKSDLQMSECTDNLTELTTISKVNISDDSVEKTLKKLIPEKTNQIIENLPSNNVANLIENINEIDDKVTPIDKSSDNAENIIKNNLDTFPIETSNETVDEANNLESVNSGEDANTIEILKSEEDENVNKTKLLNIDIESKLTDSTVEDIPSTIDVKNTIILNSKEEELSKTKLNALSNIYKPSDEENIIVNTSEILKNSQELDTNSQFQISSDTNSESKNNIHTTEVDKSIEETKEENYVKDVQNNIEMVNIRYDPISNDITTSVQAKPNIELSKNIREEAELNYINITVVGKSKIIDIQITTKPEITIKNKSESIKLKEHKYNNEESKSEMSTLLTIPDESKEKQNNIELNTSPDTLLDQTSITKFETPETENVQTILVEEILQNETENQLKNVTLDLNHDVVNIEKNSSSEMATNISTSEDNQTITMVESQESKTEIVSNISNSEELQAVSTENKNIVKEDTSLVSIRSENLQVSSTEETIQNENKPENVHHDGNTVVTTDTLKMTDIEIDSIILESKVDEILSTKETVTSERTLTQGIGQNEIKNEPNIKILDPETTIVSTSKQIGAETIKENQVLQDKQISSLQKTLEPEKPDSGSFKDSRETETLPVDQTLELKIEPLPINSKELIAESVKIPKNTEEIIEHDHNTISEDIKTVFPEEITIKETESSTRNELVEPNTVLTNNKKDIDTELEKKIQNEETVAESTVKLECPASDPITVCNAPNIVLVDKNIKIETEFISETLNTKESTTLLIENNKQSDIRENLEIVVTNTSKQVDTAMVIENQELQIEQTTPIVKSVDPEKQTSEVDANISSDTILTENSQSLLVEETTHKDIEIDSSISEDDNKTTIEDSVQLTAHVMNTMPISSTSDIDILGESLNTETKSVSLTLNIEESLDKSTPKSNVLEEETLSEPKNYGDIQPISAQEKNQNEMPTTDISLDTETIKEDSSKSIDKEIPINITETQDDKITSMDKSVELTIVLAEEKNQNVVVVKTSEQIDAQIVMMNQVSRDEHNVTVKESIKPTSEILFDSSESEIIPKQESSKTEKNPLLINLNPIKSPTIFIKDNIDLEPVSPNDDQNLSDEKTLQNSTASKTENEEINQETLVEGPLEEKDLEPASVLLNLTEFLSIEIEDITKLDVEIPTDFILTENSQPLATEKILNTEIVTNNSKLEDDQTLPEDSIQPTKPIVNTIAIDDTSNTTQVETPLKKETDLISLPLKLDQSAISAIDITNKEKSNIPLTSTISEDTSTKETIIQNNTEKSKTNDSVIPETIDINTSINTDLEILENNTKKPQHEEIISTKETSKPEVLALDSITNCSSSEIDLEDKQSENDTELLSITSNSKYSPTESMEITKQEDLKIQPTPAVSEDIKFVPIEETIQIQTDISIKNELISHKTNEKEIESDSKVKVNEQTLSIETETQNTCLNLSESTNVDQEPVIKELTKEDIKETLIVTLNPTEFTTVEDEGKKEIDEQISPDVILTKNTQTPLVEQTVHSEIETDSSNNENNKCITENSIQTATQVTDIMPVPSDNNIYKLEDSLIIETKSVSSTLNIEESLDKSTPKSNVSEEETLSEPKNVGDIQPISAQEKNQIEMPTANTSLGTETLKEDSLKVINTEIPINITESQNDNITSMEKSEELTIELVEEKNQNESQKHLKIKLIDPETVVESSEKIDTQMETKNQVSQGEQIGTVKEAVKLVSETLLDSSASEIIPEQESLKVEKDPLLVNSNPTESPIISIKDDTEVEENIRPVCVISNDEQALYDNKTLQNATESKTENENIEPETLVKSPLKFDHTKVATDILNTENVITLSTEEYIIPEKQVNDMVSILSASNTTQEEISLKTEMKPMPSPLKPNELSIMLEEITEKEKEQISLASAIPKNISIEKTIQNEIKNPTENELMKPEDAIIVTSQNIDTEIEPNAQKPQHKEMDKTEESKELEKQISKTFSMSTEIKISPIEEDLNKETELSINFNSDNLSTVSAEITNIEEEISSPSATVSEDPQSLLIEGTIQKETKYISENESVEIKSIMIDTTEKVNIEIETCIKKSKNKESLLSENSQIDGSPTSSTLDLDLTNNILKTEKVSVPLNSFISECPDVLDIEKTDLKSELTCTKTLTDEDNFSAKETIQNEIKHIPENESDNHENVAIDTLKITYAEIDSNISVPQAIQISSSDIPLEQQKINEGKNPITSDFDLTLNEEQLKTKIEFTSMFNKSSNISVHNAKKVDEEVSIIYIESKDEESITTEKTIQREIKEFIENEKVESKDVVIDTLQKIENIDQKLNNNETIMTEETVEPEIQVSNTILISNSLDIAPVENILKTEALALFTEKSPSELTINTKEEVTEIICTPTVTKNERKLSVEKIIQNKTEPNSENEIYDPVSNVINTSTDIHSEITADNSKSKGDKNEIITDIPDSNNEQTLSLEPKNLLTETIPITNTSNIFRDSKELKTQAEPVSMISNSKELQTVSIVNTNEGKELIEISDVLPTKETIQNETEKKSINELDDKNVSIERSVESTEKTNRHETTIQPNIQILDSETIIVANSTQVVAEIVTNDQLLPNKQTSLTKETLNEKKHVSQTFPVLNEPEIPRVEQTLKIETEILSTAINYKESSGLSEGNKEDNILLSHTIPDLKGISIEETIHKETQSPTEYKLKEPKTIGIETSKNIDEEPETNIQNKEALESEKLTSEILFNSSESKIILEEPSEIENNRSLVNLIESPAVFVENSLEPEVKIPSDCVKANDEQTLSDEKTLQNETTPKSENKKIDSALETGTLKSVLKPVTLNLTKTQEVPVEDKLDVNIEAATSFLKTENPQLLLVENKNQNETKHLTENLPTDSKTAVENNSTDIHTDVAIDIQKSKGVVTLSIEECTQMEKPHIDIVAIPSASDISLAETSLEVAIEPISAPLNIDALQTSSVEVTKKEETQISNVPILSEELQDISIEETIKKKNIHPEDNELVESENVFKEITKQTSAETLTNNQESQNEQNISTEKPMEIEKPALDRIQFSSVSNEALIEEPMLAETEPLPAVQNTREVEKEIPLTPIMPEDVQIVSTKTTKQNDTETQPENELVDSNIILTNTTTNIYLDSVLNNSKLEDSKIITGCSLQPTTQVTDVTPISIASSETAVEKPLATNIEPESIILNVEESSDELVKKPNVIEDETLSVPLISEVIQTISVQKINENEINPENIPVKEETFEVDNSKTTDVEILTDISVIRDNKITSTEKTVETPKISAEKNDQNERKNSLKIELLDSDIIVANTLKQADVDTVTDNQIESIKIITEPELIHISCDFGMATEQNTLEIETENLFLTSNSEESPVMDEIKPDVEEKMISATVVHDNIQTSSVEETMKTKTTPKLEYEPVSPETILVNTTTDIPTKLKTDIPKSDGHTTLSMEEEITEQPGKQVVNTDLISNSSAPIQVPLKIETETVTSTSKESLENTEKLEKNAVQNEIVDSINEPVLPKKRIIYTPISSSDTDIEIDTPVSDDEQTALKNETIGSKKQISDINSISIACEETPLKESLVIETETQSLFKDNSATQLKEQNNKEMQVLASAQIIKSSDTLIENPVHEETENRSVTSILNDINVVSINDMKSISQEVTSETLQNNTKSVEIHTLNKVETEIVTNIPLMNINETVLDQGINITKVQSSTLPVLPNDSHIVLSGEPFEDTKIIPSEIPIISPTITSTQKQVEVHQISESDPSNSNNNICSISEDKQSKIEINISSEAKVSDDIPILPTVRQNKLETETIIPVLNKINTVIEKPADLESKYNQKSSCSKLFETEKLETKYSSECGETSKKHLSENENKSQEKSYGIQKLEMSVQRMKTSDDDYFEKTFVQLEQTEKISMGNTVVKDENNAAVDDKQYTVNESDLNAILCASSLQEALTLLDTKIKFKFKHNSKKSSSKVNSTDHKPNVHTPTSSSSNKANFTEARKFFKEMEKKSKK